MAIIREIIGEKTITLTRNSKDDPFSDFFGIDSLHIVLGKNGSGKTHLLNSIAKSLSSKDESMSVLIEPSDHSGSRFMSKIDKKNHGAIFFTSLPYRRKIPQSSNVLDVSPSPTQRDLIGEIDVFKKVSADLKIDTSLRGYVGYALSIYAELLLPALLQAGAEPEENFSPNMLQALKILRDPRSSESLQNRFAQEEHLREARRTALRELCSSIEWRRGDRTLVELAVLQKMVSSSRQGTFLAASYLQLAGIIHGNFLPNDEFVSQFESMADNTFQDIQNCSGNSAFGETKNEISFEISSEVQARRLLNNNTAVRIAWSDLSSGMRAFVEQFSELRRGVVKLRLRGIRNVLLLIDEGDAYLHLDWQRRYIEMLDRFLTALKKDLGLDVLQVVMTTHSPVVATDLPSCMVTNLDVGVSPRQTFAAPIDDIVLTSFGSSSIGTFAAEKIDKLYSRLLNGERTKDDAVLIEEIGDFIIKNALLRIRGANS